MEILMKETVGVIAENVMMVLMIVANRDVALYKLLSGSV